MDKIEGLANPHNFFLHHYLVPVLGVVDVGDGDLGGGLVRGLNIISCYNLNNDTETSLFPHIF